MKDSCQNTISLEKLVNFYIQHGMMKDVTVDSQEKQMMAPILRRNIIDSIREEIQASITKDEADAIHHDAMTRHRQQEMRERTQQIRNLLLEGIVFSFFIGLLVNLATELLDMLSPSYKVVAAVICILIITVLYFYRLLGQIHALLHPDQEGDSDTE